MKLTALSIKKDFPRAGRTSNFFTAVRETDFELCSGQMIVITGRSGSGKSTLLNMLAGLLKPSAGKVLLDGTDVYSLGDRALSMLRNRFIGLIPQSNTALNSLTVLENVVLPTVLYSPAEPPCERAQALLAQLGLGLMPGEKPGALSGGELRRLCVARALISQPGLVLADEPTAGLDDENTLSVLSLLRKSADDGAGVLVVTHEKEAERFADSVFTMNAGLLSR
ncbi:MAG: ATP-binding cassette domain-containing protein [Clostridia bacterium]|nr:ATP-binding cassette domain-containing protein [Clostridia bacterium]